MYEHSGGVTANVVTLVHDTQEVAIINGSERMDIANFNEAYNSRMGMLHSKIVIDKVKKSSATKKCKTEIVRVELPELKDISIENIINEAKDKGIDVVKCLRQYVSVQEVGV